MSKLQWDQTGERRFEYGSKKAVLFPMTAKGLYPKGVAWNGLLGVDENPDGADEQVIYADDIKYATWRTPENHKGAIKAVTYPPEWKKCNGMASPDGLEGMTMGQQTRQAFGFCYTSTIGNDTAVEEDDGYIVHIVYNSTVSPSSVSHNTKNESPENVEFSWDYSSTPVPVETIEGVHQTCTVELNSLELGKAKMAAIEEVLYGSETADARLPLPDEIYTILKGVA